MMYSPYTFIAYIDDVRDLKATTRGGEMFPYVSVSAVANYTECYLRITEKRWNEIKDVIKEKRNVHAKITALDVYSPIDSENIYFTVLKVENVLKEEKPNPVFGKL